MELLILRIGVFINYSGIDLWWVPQNPIDDVIIGLGLVPLGSKPLPDAMLTQIFIDIWHH